MFICRLVVYMRMYIHLKHIYILLLSLTCTHVTTTPTAADPVDHAYNRTHAYKHCAALSSLRTNTDAGMISTNAVDGIRTYIYIYTCDQLI